MSARSSRDIELDAEAALADRVDEAARREPRQRLAQRRRADAVTRGRLDNAEAAVGGKRAAKNVGLDPLRRALGSVSASASTSRKDELVRGRSIVCSMSCCFIVSIHQAKIRRLSTRASRRRAR